jgi:hypothetical protein
MDLKDRRKVFTMDEISGQNDSPQSRQARKGSIYCASYPSLRFKILIFFLPVLWLTLACRTFSRAGETYQESKEALEAVVTLARGVATQHPGLLETAGSFVVEEGLSLAGTAEAFATQNPGLLETARALAEEKGPTMLGTAQALATEQPGLIETAKAIVSSGSGQQSPLPDIPVFSSQPIDIHYSAGLALSYSTEGAYQTILNFYKTEMPANGWELDIPGSFEEGNMASLVYAQPERNATVTISFSEATGRTLVVIFTEDR